MAYQIRYDPIPPRKRACAVLFPAGVAAVAFVAGNFAPLKAGFTALLAGEGWYEAALVWCRMTLGLIPG